MSIKNDIKSKLVCLVSASFLYLLIRLSAIQKKMAATENKVDKIVKKFNMCPHPEGGFYKRIFESSTTIHTPFGKRFSMTSINYLMTYGNFNAFHLLKQNSEVLYFHDVSLNISHILFYKMTILKYYINCNWPLIQLDHFSARNGSKQGDYKGDPESHPLF